MDKGLRVSTLGAELQVDTALLLKSPFSLCSTRVVLIALNFLPMGA